MTTTPTRNGRFCFGTSNAPPSPNFHSAGFTLVEVLVVLAIIILLAGIILPVFAQVREKGRSATCQTNLKQIVGATLMYAQDFDEKLPNATFVAVPAQYDSYIKGAIAGSGVLACPSGMGYGWNGHLFGPLEAVPGSRCPPGTYPAACDLSWNTGYAYPYGKGRSLASVSLPAQTPLVFEGYVFPVLYNWAFDAADAFDGSKFTNRHQGGCNYAFVDGHVKWFHSGASPLFVKSDAMDYDGDGRVGTAETLR